MFICKLKDEPDIEYDKRFKSRLVVLGNHQDPECHFNEKELSSPVLKASSLRVMTAKAAGEGCNVTHGRKFCLHQHTTKGVDLHEITEGTHRNGVSSSSKISQKYVWSSSSAKKMVRS